VGRIIDDETAFEDGVLDVFFHIIEYAVDGDDLEFLLRASAGVHISKDMPKAMPARIATSALQCGEGIGWRPRQILLCGLSIPIVVTKREHCLGHHGPRFAQYGACVCSH
jgi:hypothetical protein